MITDTPRAASLRAVAFGDESDADLTERMRVNAPHAGVAGPHVRSSRSVPRSALRLLDSRILTTALSFLDDEPGPLLLTGVTRFRQLTKAARATRAAPGTHSVATILEPYSVVSKQHPNVAVIVDEREVARIDFELVVAFEMCETSAVVRYGAIESVDCTAGSLNVSLSLAGASPPLLQREAAFPLRWDVQPPIRIPLAEQPAPADPTRRTRFAHRVGPGAGTGVGARDNPA